MLRGSTEDEVRILWNPSTDESGDDVSYIVYVNGEKAAETDQTEYVLKDVAEGEVYHVRLVAADANGNKSLASSFHFTLEDVKGLKVTGVEALDKITVEKGTSAKDLDLPKTVMVTLEDTRLSDELEVNWQTAGFDGDTVGTYTLEGELVLKDGIENPDGVKAVITVEVTADGKPSTDPGDGSQDGGNGGTGQSTDKDGAVQTGDSAPILAEGIILVLSAGAVIFMLRKRVRK